MRDFFYVRVDTPAQAVAALADPEAKLIAGGTEMVNLLKERIETPRLLVDIGRTGLDQITVDAEGTLRLGALAHMSDVAADPAVRAGWPAVARALEKSASAQLRNAATMGGNMLQRTRCPYFRADHDLPCNKRRPGSGCAAIEGDNRNAALFGASEHCVATHPSDVAVALAALDAVLTIQGPGGSREVPIGEFHRLPGAEPERDTELGRDEMIVSLAVPGSAAARASRYLKVRERTSYEFALVSVASSAVLEGGTVTEARIALGGVAPRPWRLREAEAALVGAELTEQAVRQAVAPAFSAARPLRDNVFKVELAQRAIVRALIGGHRD